MSQPRLLLIDDEPALAEFLANAAKACGFQPIVTARDDQFRDAFIENQPEMVALDLGMPGMDGVELTRFLADQDYPRTGPDRQRLRPPRARICLPAGRGPWTQDGRAGGKAGPV